jgi:hypothetical protein
MMEKEIKEFTESIGAKKADEYRSIFKRPNYFLLGKNFLIVKLSRSYKPF